MTKRRRIKGQSTNGGIQWNPGEMKALLPRVAAEMAKPGMSLAVAFFNAQQAVLPAERQRPRTSLYLSCGKGKILARAFSAFEALNTGEPDFVAVKPISKANGTHIVQTSIGEEVAGIMSDAMVRVMAALQRRQTEALDNQFSEIAEHLAGLATTMREGKELSS